MNVLHFFIQKVEILNLDTIQTCDTRVDDFVLHQAQYSSFYGFLKEGNPVMCSSSKNTKACKIYNTTNSNWASMELEPNDKELRYIGIMVSYEFIQSSPRRLEATGTLYKPWGMKFILFSREMERTIPKFLCTLHCLGAGFCMCKKSWVMLGIDNACGLYKLLKITYKAYEIVTFQFTRWSQKYFINNSMI